jgi:hypothetical protein
MRPQRMYKAVRRWVKGTSPSTWPGLGRIVLKLTACLWAVARAGCKPGAQSITAGGDAQAADELSQHLLSFIMGA